MAGIDAHLPPESTLTIAGTRTIVWAILLEDLPQLKVVVDGILAKE